MIMPKQHGSASSDTKRTERNGGENYKPYGLQKTQNKEFLIINACYSVTKYYLCRQNNKRSLLGRKQRSQVARSFPNRYLFSFTNKVTSLFSISCILRIILVRNLSHITSHSDADYTLIWRKWQRIPRLIARPFATRHEKRESSNRLSLGQR